MYRIRGYSDMALALLKILKPWKYDKRFEAAFRRSFLLTAGYPWTVAFATYRREEVLRGYLYRADNIDHGADRELSGTMFTTVKQFEKELDAWLRQYFYLL